VRQHAVKGRVSEGAHLAERDVYYLPFLTCIVNVVSIYSFVVFESLELIHLANKRLSGGKRIRRPNLVDQDSIGVDLS